MKIEYRHVMGDRKKPYSIHEDDAIPAHIREIILNNSAFSQPRTFGEKGLGAPEEIEDLIIHFDNGEKREFHYYNKGIHYMTYGGEDERPIFQVFACFMSRTD